MSDRRIKWMVFVPFMLPYPWAKRPISSQFEFCQIAPSLDWLCSRYSAILSVSGLMACPCRAKCGRSWSSVANGDCGARASSSKSMRVYAATWDSRGWFERVAWAWGGGGVTTRIGVGGVLLGCVVLEADNGLVAARLRCSRRRRRLPVAPVLIAKVVFAVAGRGAKVTLLGGGGTLRDVSLRGGSIACFGCAVSATLRGMSTTLGVEGLASRVAALMGSGVG